MNGSEKWLDILTYHQGAPHGWAAALPILLLILIITVTLKVNVSASFLSRQRTHREPCIAAIALGYLNGYGAPQGARPFPTTRKYVT
jgi:hypothetical protein